MQWFTDTQQLNDTNKRLSLHAIKWHSPI